MCVTRILGQRRRALAAATAWRSHLDPLHFLPHRTRPPIANSAIELTTAHPTVGCYWRYRRRTEGTVLAPKLRMCSAEIGAAPVRPRLLDRVRSALKLRHYSQRTEESYVQWIRRFIVFHGKRHPEEMAEPEVVAFLTDLAERHKVSASTQNQALCALLFLYRHVLGRQLGAFEGIVWAKREVISR